MNAGDSQDRTSSKKSLFSRMTGLGLAGQKSAPSKPAEPQLMKPASQETAAPQPAPAMQQPAPTPSHAPEQTSAPAQDLTPSKAEEEMLEIPAFLRRQAN